MRYAALLRAFEQVYPLPEAQRLLQPRWLLENQRPGAPASTGFCYIAAEAAFHFLKHKWPTGMCAVYEEDGAKCTHWWIQIGSKIVDPTASQYTGLGENPPYHLGRGKGFLTSHPSKRAATLMKLVRERLRPEVLEAVSRCA